MSSIPTMPPGNSSTFPPFPPGTGNGTLPTIPTVPTMGPNSSTPNKVNCGGHYAKSCSECCTSGCSDEEADEWCSGDCKWNGNECAFSACLDVNHVNDNPGHYSCDCVESSDPCFA